MIFIPADFRLSTLPLKVTLSDPTIDHVAAAPYIETCFTRVSS
jgi:hypothetical protein